MHLFLFVFTIIWTSFCLAELEIAIEGTSGWAENLPTWRIGKENVLSRMLSGVRELTGYHLWLHVFIFSIMHLVYVFVDWEPEIEIQLVSFLFSLWVVEDFLWFVVNPGFGIKKFKKEYIWWHEKNWWWIAPKEYFIFLPLAAALYYVSYLV
jgi:hypothetical protein